MSILTSQPMSIILSKYYTSIIVVDSFDKAKSLKDVMDLVYDLKLADVDCYYSPLPMPDGDRHQVTIIAKKRSPNEERDKNESI